MPFTGPPAVDFYSQLSGLGDTLQANAALRQKQQINATRQEAFSNFTALDPNSPDYGKQAMTIAQKLGSAGDQEGAIKFLTVAQSAAERARQAQRDTVTDSHWNQSFELQKRAAARADDPTPDNFVADKSASGGYRPIGPADPAYIENVAAAKARAAANAPPDGFAKLPDGTYAPLPGGPQDPAYLGGVAKAKAEAEASLPGGGGLSLNPVYGKDTEGNTVLLQPGKNGVAVQSKLPEGVTLNGVDDATLQADAARLNAGDPNILKKYSNKGQGRVDLLRLNNEANRQREAKGQAPIDLTQNTITYQGDTARERAAGTMEGRMAPASIEAQGAFKIAQNAADNLWRTNSVPLNRVIQMGQAATSNPELKAAAVAFNTAVMTYSRAIAPTGVGTVDSQQHAREILDKADGPKATEAAFAQLAREVDMAHASPGIARQYFAAARKARMEGRPAPEMPTYQPARPEAGAPPPDAIAALKNDPRRAADFDAYYGAGSAKAALSGSR